MGFLNNDIFGQFGNANGAGFNGSGGATFSNVTSMTGSNGIRTSVAAPTVRTNIPLLEAAGGINGNSSEVQLPSWLKTNPDDLMHELMTQYTDAPNTILKGADDVAQKGGRAADYAYASNTRSASNAALDAANRAMQSGGAVGAGAIKAQLSEKAEAGRVDAKLKIAEQQQQARVQAATLSSDIAKTIAGLRSSYLGQLAGVSTSLRGQNLGFTSDSTKNALTQEDISNRFSLGAESNSINAATAAASIAAKLPAPATFSNGFNYAGSNIFHPGYMG